MSWWAQTIANTLRLDDDPPSDQNPNSDDEPPSPERGVKEDLSELTQTLSRQFWGVASFLAPPPADQPAGIAGIKSDFAEIGGRFRTGISKLSDNIVNTDFTKIASDLLQLGPEDGDDVAEFGVTEEVVAFARDISTRPETWLDFPLPDEDDEFDMSDAQQEHALAVERLVPGLSALRIELCPGYMSESCFWMIYFVLLHPHLNEHDAELLSTPEVVKATALLTRGMQNKTKGKSVENQPENYNSGGSSISPQSNVIPLEAVHSEPGSSALSDKFETDKHPILSSEVPVIDKSVIEEEPVIRLNEQNKHSGSNSEDEADDWLKEENSDTAGTGTGNGTGTGTTTVPIENDEDVSFSDLEEDDEDASTSYKKVAYGSDSSTKESRDWVQLGRSSTDSTKDINTVGSEQVSGPNSDTKDSSDWLDLEEIDVE